MRSSCLPDHHHHHRRSHLAVIIFATLSAVLHQHPLVASADDSSLVVVSVSPSRLFVEDGTPSVNTISCSVDQLGLSPSNNTVAYLRWVGPDSSPLDESSASNSSRIFYNSSSGDLTLKDAQVNDTGTYVCYYADVTQCAGGSESGDVTLCPNASLTYKVYVMPDYTTDGIVIGIINGVLLVIFIASLIRTAVIDRRRLKKYGQKL